VCEGTGPECDEEYLNWLVSLTEQELELVLFYLTAAADCKYIYTFIQKAVSGVFKHYSILHSPDCLLKAFLEVSC